MNKSRLADSRLADEGDKLAAPISGIRHDGVQSIEFGCATHQARQSPRGRCGLQTRARRVCGRDFVDWQGIGQSLDRNQSKRQDVEQAFNQAERRRSNQCCRGSGKLLHAGRERHGLADCCIVHTKIVADGAYHHLAGIEPDADLDLSFTWQPGVRPKDRRVHGQRGIAGACRVILVGNRRSEQRDNAVTRDLGHRPRIAVGGFHHMADRVVQNLANLLGVAVGDEGQRIFDVGEQDGILLSLGLRADISRPARGGELFQRLGQRWRTNLFV